MHRLVTVILLLLFMGDLNGQPGSSAGEILRHRLSNFCEAVPREEIYLHSDRDEYISGEDLWFKVYLFDRQSGVVSGSSSIAYIELINPDNRPVVRRRISLDKGLGSGHFVLPDTLSTGRYNIRVYTNWMKNFMPSNCYVRDIAIYNALSERVFRGKPGYDDPFPGLKNRDKKRTDFGIELSTIRNVSGTIDLWISTNENFRTSNDNKCCLLIQTHGVVDLVRDINLQSGEVTVTISDSILAPGINEIVIFDSALRVVSEKYIYTPVREVDSRDFAVPETLNKRQKTEIVLQLKEDSIETLNKPDLSISVTPHLANKMNQSLEDYMLFATEFGNLPESFRNHKLSEIPDDTINRFLESAKSNWIDWDMIVSGRKPLVKHLKEKDFHYLTGRFIDKVTRQPLQGKTLFLSIPGKTAIFQYSRTDSEGLFSFALPVKGEVKDLIIQPEEPDINGSVLAGSTFYDDYFQENKKKDTSLFIVPDYISKLGVNYQISIIYGIDFTQDIRQKSVPDQTRRFYGKPDIDLLMVDYILLPLMEEVFFELTPGVQLKRKRNSYSMLVADPGSGRIYEKPPLLFIDGVVINDPAVIAGLDPEAVEKIEIVKDLYMVGDFMFFGIVNVITKAGDYSGVTLPDYAVRLKYRVIEPSKLFSAPDYSSADMQESRIPDFRNTLYWNPSINTDKAGRATTEFWTSDLTGSFEISIQGVNIEGRPVFFKKSITVR